MPHSLYRDLISLTEEFEAQNQSVERQTVENFSIWLSAKTGTQNKKTPAPSWEGKENGRSTESVINTSLVHLYRYAKIYSKIAIEKSPFTTIDEVIFLINLMHLGSMTKIKLIALNIHEKSTGIQIINRLLKNGFIDEDINNNDKRSKNLHITILGRSAVDSVMDKVKEASKIVTGDLTNHEKLELVSLLQKLDFFHRENIKLVSQNRQ